MKLSIKDFFSKCDQIRSFLQIWSHLLKKSLMENFIFCVVDNVSLPGNFNSCIKDSPMKLFCEISKLRSLIKEPACFKNRRIMKHPSRGVLMKRCSENMQQIYRRTPMSKCDFNKVALQLY